MTATMSYLSRMTEEFFERQMRRAAKGRSKPDAKCSPTITAATAVSGARRRARRFIFSLAIRNT